VVVVLVAVHQVAMELLAQTVSVVTVGLVRHLR
jgi:hypothetical protein